MKTEERVYSFTCDGCGAKDQSEHWLPGKWFEVTVEDRSDYSETCHYCSKECANEATKGGLIK